MENTVKAHADYLKENNPEKYREMMAMLALFGYDTYFYNTLCLKPGYSLFEVKSKVRDIMCEFLGFTPRHFAENVLPALPKQEAAL